MITLYTFGPAFGLPDPSPFVMKAQMLLKLAKLPFEETPRDSSARPKANYRSSTTTAPSSPIPR